LFKDFVLPPYRKARFIQLPSCWNFNGTVYRPMNSAPGWISSP
jgi:hypothetical protein